MAKSKFPSQDDPQRWTLTAHCCRICFGRVLTRTTFDGRKIYICSNCETTIEGDGPQCLCCCGIKLRKSVDAGIRCTVNPNRTPENVSVILAEQLSAPKTTNNPTNGI